MYDSKFIIFTIRLTICTLSAKSNKQELDSLFKYKKIQFLINYILRSNKIIKYF